MKTFKDFYDKGGATFCAVVHGNLLTAQKTSKDGQFVKKTVRVEDCSEFTYKLMKTKIKAAGGASGLLAFLERCETIADLFSCHVSRVYNYIFDEMKEAA